MSKEEKIDFIKEEKGMIRIFSKDIVQYWFPLKWWNSPYSEGSDKE